VPLWQGSGNVDALRIVPVLTRNSMSAKSPRHVLRVVGPGNVLRPVIGESFVRQLEFRWHSFWKELAGQEPYR
jgi:hypothetical protein